MTPFETLCRSLEDKIKDAYTSGVTMEEAEKLAGEFLSAQLAVSQELKTSDLDSRMRKTGVKAVRAAIYMQEAAKGDKKPTEAALGALVDSNEVVQAEQNEFDKAEVERDELSRYYSIFQNAHIFYRGVAKGNFGG